MDLKGHEIQLEIRELVLVGFNPAQGEAIRQAVVAELQHLLSTQGLPSMGGEYRPLADGGEVALSADTAALSAEIAQAIYRGLGA